jgi:hypothetical protein
MPKIRLRCRECIAADANLSVAISTFRPSTLCLHRCRFLLSRMRPILARSDNCRGSTTLVRCWVERQRSCDCWEGGGSSARPHPDIRVSGAPCVRSLAVHARPELLQRRWRSGSRTRLGEAKIRVVHLDRGPLRQDDPVRVQLQRCRSRTLTGSRQPPQLRSRVALGSGPVRGCQLAAQRARREWQSAPCETANSSFALSCLISRSVACVPRWMSRASALRSSAAAQS